MELQFRHAREVLHIARQQDELVVDRGCRDQQVKIGYELALSAKVGADASKTLRVGIIECQQREASEESAKASELSRGIRGANGTFEELAIGDDADSKAHIPEPAQ